MACRYSLKTRGVCHLSETDLQLGEVARGAEEPVVHHHGQTPDLIREQRLNTSYRHEVDPWVLRDAVEEITEKYLAANYHITCGIDVCCTLHRFVRKHFSYEDGWEPPRRFRSVRQMCSINKGNCEEQAVFMGSLLLNVEGVDVKLLELQGYDCTHLSVVASFTYVDSDGFRQENKSQVLFDYYRENTGWRPDSVNYYESEGRKWYYIDPVMCRFVGDNYSLKNQGYITGGNLHIEEKWDL